MSIEQMPILSPAMQEFLNFAQFDQQAAVRVEQATNWQDKYRHIMLLGKAMPAIAPEFRLDAAQVKGCESKAWFYHLQIKTRHYFIIDSEARVVKGLAGLLLAACNGKSSQEITAFDAKGYFSRLGLAQQLSPSRTNGLQALVDAIQRTAR